MGEPSSYRIAGIAIIICLIAAGTITLLGGPHQTGNTTVIDSTIPGYSGNISRPGGDTQNTPPVSNRIRILWYDTTSRTYTFRDYDRPDGTDQSTWTEKEMPSPENGTLQRQAAMVRFLVWDGTIERMTGTKYLTDQETITSILNSYTLIAPPPPDKAAPGATETPEISPTPDITPAPGMLIPTVGQPCSQADGTIRVSFGYTSRHNTQVSLPVGDRNRFTPGDPYRGQPSTFLPGIHKDVFTVTYPENGTNIVWNLMNNAVSAGTVPRLLACLTAEPLAGYAPLTVRFTDLSAGGTSENPLTGVWNLGDGTTDDGTAISHRYELPGTFKVNRIVSTSCGSETANTVISVYRTDFKAEPVPGTPRTFRFTDISTGNPAVRFWDFNDGFSSWETGPVHTFTSPGKYAIGLTVSGKAGSGSTVHTIIVE